MREDSCNGSQQFPQCLKRLSSRWRPSQRGVHGVTGQIVKGVPRDHAVGTIALLDGYVEDAEGSFDWAAPDRELLSFVNDLERSVGTYLYGRRMYQIMLYWESAHTIPHQPDVVRDFTEIWQAADKIVYSKMLAEPSSRRTRLERDFDPEAIWHLEAKARADITVGGAELASRALRSTLVDELQLFLVPVLIGAGKSALPRHVLLGLQLLDERRFTSGVVYLRYRVKAA